MNGAVSAGSETAVAAARAVLESGGNAIDAAIAASATQCVAELPWCGLGGDAFVLVRTAEGATFGFNGSGAAPAAISTALGDHHKVPRFGPLSVAVPGLVDTWAQLHERFGTRPLSDLLDPARQLALDGVVIDGRLAAALAEVADMTGGDQFAPLLDGCDLAAGSVLRQPKLAATIEAIGSSGGDEFYRGVVAKQIAAHLASRGGALAIDDLERHRGRWVTPATVSYRGHTVSANAPVSMGVLLLACLQMLEARGASHRWPDLATQVEEMVRLKKVAFGTILPELGDPADHGAIDVLSAEATHRWSTTVDGAIPAAPDDGGTDTTSLAVAAADGSMVVFIHSLFNEFGAREYVADAGIVLNDRLANLQRGDHPNAVSPGRRPMHTLHAYLVDTADGRTYAGATPGGRGQVQTNMQVLLNLLDDGLDLQAAVDAPRWVHGMPRVAPDDPTLYLEPALADLEPALHHHGLATEVVTSTMHDHFGNCTIVGRDADKSLSAASDHRRGGAAEAW